MNRQHLPPKILTSEEKATTTITGVETNGRLAAVLKMFEKTIADSVQRL